MGALSVTFAACGRLLTSKLFPAKLPLVNRLLSISSLLLSTCAFVVALLLWREMSLSRADASRQTLHERLSDEQLATVQGYFDDTRKKFEEKTVARSDVLMAERLLNRARFMHGDISRGEWHRLNLTSGSEYLKLIIARFKVGAGTPPDLCVFYDDLLESSR